MSRPASGKERDVRYREEAFELKCLMCDEFWPITLEFWRPRAGMQRCVACWREYHRLKMRITNADERTRAVKNYKNRLRYHENREARKVANRVYKASHREQIHEYNARYRASHRAADGE